MLFLCFYFKMAKLSHESRNSTLLIRLQVKQNHAVEALIMAFKEKIQKFAFIEVKH